MLLQPSIYLLYTYLRPLLKWFLHRFTGLCELQRICYGTAAGARRTRSVEHSLRLSRQPRIRQMIVHLDAKVQQQSGVGGSGGGGQLEAAKQFSEQYVVAGVGAVLHCKRIDVRVHPDMAEMLRGCLESAWGYRRLYTTVEQLRCTVYDAGCIEHERKLLRLWQLLCPDVPLETRITKQWQDIGFQGDDPKTDFRGMGMLGLDNLLYFAQELNGAARHVLSHSQHPRYGYTFAIVGINLTSMAYKLLKSGAAKNHFYNRGTRSQSSSSSSSSSLSIEAFHKFYCYLVYEFDRFWMECKPTSIMEFSAISERFEASLAKRLAEDAVCLRINLAVENV